MFRSASTSPDTSPSSRSKPSFAIGGAMKTMRELWAGVLSRPSTNLPLEDGFFELGGNSLLAMRLTNAINAKFLTAIPTSYLLEQSSVSQFMANLSSVGQSIELIPRLSQSEAALAQPSLIQEAFFHLQKRQPLLKFSNLTEFFNVLPDFDLTAFEAALRRVVRRHEALRTLIKETENGDLRLEVTMLFPEFEHIQLENEEAEMMAQLKEFHERPFNLSTDLPIRTALFERNGELCILALGFHHVTTDGWSLEILLRELSAFYKNRSQGMESSAITFKDYATFQRNRVSLDPPHQSIEFWRSYLTNVKPLCLPTSQPRPVSFVDDGVSVDFELSEEVSQALKSLAKNWDVSLFSLLLANYFIVLGRLSGQSEPSLITTVANREHFQLEHLVGVLCSDIPLRQRIEPGNTFKDFVVSVSQNLRIAKEHGAVPLPRILFAAGLALDERENPEELFPAYFQLSESRKELNMPLQSYAGSEKLFGCAAMNYVLSAWLDSAGPSIQVTLIGALEVVDPELLKNWSDTYRAMLTLTAECSGENTVQLRVGQLADVQVNV